MAAVRKAVPSDFLWLLQIWEKAIKATHTFLAQQDFEFFRSELQSRWLPPLELNVFIDVNEQNPQAMRFYEKYGFIVTSRSETDAFGKPYPLVHMQLGKGG